MKHLKFFPLLIAAAFYMPRAAHAAETGLQEPSSYGTALICIGLVVLAASGGSRTASFKAEQN